MPPSASTETALPVAMPASLGHARADVLSDEELARSPTKRALQGLG